MGEIVSDSRGSLRVLFGGCCGLLLVCATAVGQALKNERHVLARQRVLRAELLSACLTAYPEARAQAAIAVGDLSRAEPLVPYVRAIAAARGEVLTPAAEARARLLAIVVPEVIDLQRFEGPSVTVMTHRRVELPASTQVWATLQDPKGRVLADFLSDPVTDPSDWLRARVSGLLAGPVSSEVTNLAVEIETLVDGAQRRPWELGIVSKVWVCPDFAARAQRLPLSFVALHPEFGTRDAEVDRITESLESKFRTAPDRALVRGAIDRVNRAFRGEPRLPGVDPIEDLVWVEEILARAERRGAAGEEAVGSLRDEILDSLRGQGRRVVGLPVAPLSRVTSPPGAGPSDAVGPLLTMDYSQVSFALPDPAAGTQPRPLIVVYVEQPTWDGAADRPSSRWVEQPEWLAAELELAGLDLSGRDENYHVAILESPGRKRPTVQALIDTTRQLRELLPVDPSRVVWVGHGASTCFSISRALLKEPGLASRAVFVGGGAFSNPELKALGDAGVQSLVVSSAGQSRASSLRSLVKRAEGRCTMTWLPGEDTRPWPIALPLVVDAILELAKR